MSYDQQNLEYSALFLLGSLTTKFRTEIEHSVGLTATGIEVLLCIIERRYSLQVSLQRELVAKLEKLDIIQEPGENISNFNIKVKNRLLEKSEYALRYIYIIGFKTFIIRC